MHLFCNPPLPTTVRVLGDRGAGLRGWRARAIPSPHCPSASRSRSRFRIVTAGLTHAGACRSLLSLAKTLWATLPEMEAFWRSCRVCHWRTEVVLRKSENDRFEAMPSSFRRVVGTPVPKRYAVPGLIIAGIRPVLWLLDWLSRFDTVRAYAGRVMTFLDSAFGVASSFLLGLGLIAYAIWRGLRSDAVLPEQSAGSTDTSREAEEVKKQLAQTQNALAKEGERYSELVAQKARWQDTCTVLSNEQERLQELIWRIEYDQNRPERPALNERDTELARIEIARLQTPLQRLKSSVAPVADDLVHRARNRGDAEGEFGAWFADLFIEHIVRHCQRGFLFVERPQDWQLDALEAFARWFWGYRQFREWVPRVALALGIDEAEVRGYSAWREADATLFAKFDDFALPWLRGFVQQHRQSGYPQNLNRAATEAPVSKHLRSSSKDEMSFLYLFCIDELPMVPGKPETFLPNAVYNAGVGLVKHRILTHETTAEGLGRFCLTDMTRAVWDQSDRGMPLLKRCVDIDLHSVWGTGASGGGARGSE